MSARWWAAGVVVQALLLSACTRYTYEAVQTDPVPEEELAVDLYLIGDAGRPDPEGEPVLIALTEALKRDPERSMVLFLGDNLYPDGLPDSLDLEHRSLAEWVLGTQLDVLRDSRARGIFLPGNHDWQAGGPEGWETLRRQEAYIEAHGDGLADFLPDDGCPGPVVRDVGEVLRLVLLDTQWWLHQEGLKPLHPESGCPHDSEEEVIAGIAEALEGAEGRVTVAAGHHPILTAGHHGGYFDWPAYLVPVYPLARRMGWFAPQDVGSRQYRNMIQALSTAFSAAPLTVYAAGHEHNLQVLNGTSARYLVVSGTGIYGHLTPVRVIPSTLYAEAVSGFVRLSIRDDGWTRLAVVTVDEDASMSEVYSFWIEPNPRQP